MDNELLFLVLLPASLFDLYRYRIPNAIPVSGIIIGLIRHLELQGLNGVWPWLTGMIVPLFLFYLLHRFRMFGAGDGKLLAAVGAFVGLPRVFFVLFFSLLTGAFLSVIKLLVHRNLRARFEYLCSYTNAVISGQKVIPYYDKKSDGDDGVIPFGVAISFGTLSAALFFE
ncbi:MAG: prepilin peptidase [Eubacterium sp.]|nr:prepilin peptidase [Eubacterium sp.]